MTKVFDYEEMVQKALLGVVKEILHDVSKNGLPGEHHYYITFQTNRHDVELPSYLLKRHPEEITIVLQHQYWDLEVQDDYFEVSLSFNDVREKIHVPFIALINVQDPHKKFNLQFLPKDPPQTPSAKSKSSKKKAIKKADVQSNVFAIYFSLKK